tara:strand:+ start:872 stop:1057 length:186 start_codon:yes stop_codon:yes gene_type:complete
MENILKQKREIYELEREIYNLDFKLYRMRNRMKDLKIKFVYEVNKKRKELKKEREKKIEKN